jgi:hypothetical protein
MRFIDLLASSLRLVNAIGSGESIPGNEAADGLVIFNQMLDSWSAESLAVFQIQRQVVVPATAKQVYTLGLTGDFNIARPPRLERMGVLSLANAAQPAEYPLEMVTDVGWQAIPVKNIPSSLPKVCWNDNGFPLMNLSLWPVPNVLVNYALYTWTSLTQVAAINTDIQLPPSYLKALRYNFAIDLAPEWGRDQISPMITQQAADTKAIIKRMNLGNRPLEMACDAGVQTRKVGLYNYITDGPITR